MGGQTKKIQSKCRAGGAAAGGRRWGSGRKVSRERIRPIRPTAHSTSRVSHSLASCRAPPPHRWAANPLAHTHSSHRKQHLPSHKTHRGAGVPPTTTHRRRTHTLHTPRAVVNRRACTPTRKRKKRGTDGVARSSRRTTTSSQSLGWEREKR